MRSSISKQQRIKSTNEAVLRVVRSNYVNGQLTSGNVEAVSLDISAENGWVPIKMIRKHYQ